MIPQDFKNAVKNKDIITIRAIIKNQIISDQIAHESLAKAEMNYALNERVQLYAEDDGESCFVDECNQWTEDLFETLYIELHDNFSQRKVDNLFRVMSYLRQAGHPSFQVKKTKSSTQAEDRTKHLSSSPTRFLIAGGIAILACAFLAYKALTE